MVLLQVTLLVYSRYRCCTRTLIPGNVNVDAIEHRDPKGIIATLYPLLLTSDGPRSTCLPKGVGEGDAVCVRLTACTS